MRTSLLITTVAAALLAATTFAAAQNAGNNMNSNPASTSGQASNNAQLKQDQAPVKHRKTAKSKARTSHAMNSQAADVKRQKNPAKNTPAGSQPEALKGQDNGASAGDKSNNPRASGTVGQGTQPRTPAAKTPAGQQPANSNGKGNGSSAGDKAQPGTTGQAPSSAAPAKTPAGQQPAPSRGKESGSSAGDDSNKK
jgi:hypothetical protein